MKFKLSNIFVFCKQAIHRWPIHMSRSNGQPEVIVNYADGFAYSKHKMEEAFRHLDKPPAKSLVGGKSDSSLVKKEDVDLIVHEFEIPRIQAEKVLVENGGDLDKALRALVAPSSTAPITVE